MNYVKLNFATQVEQPLAFVGDRYLVSAHASDGYTITRKGDFYYVTRPDYEGQAIEIHASRVNGAFLTEK